MAIEHKPRTGYADLSSIRIETANDNSCFIKTDLLSHKPDRYLKPTSIEV